MMMWGIYIKARVGNLDFFESTIKKKDYSKVLRECFQQNVEESSLLLNKIVKIHSMRSTITSLHCIRAFVGTSSPKSPRICYYLQRGRWKDVKKRLMEGRSGILSVLAQKFANSMQQSKKPKEAQINAKTPKRILYLISSIQRKCPVPSLLTR